MPVLLCTVPSLAGLDAPGRHSLRKMLQRRVARFSRARVLSGTLMNEKHETRVGLASFYSSPGAAKQSFLSLLSLFPSLFKFLLFSQLTHKNE
mmetsp:Transcript_20884/g.40954  ORF Transcript_20884/g.40954 Transcript_20884/m.40954 type:complete len:93 (-) Transcript_20884:261-539(-)